MAYLARDAPVPVNRFLWMLPFFPVLLHGVQVLTCALLSLGCIELSSRHAMAVKLASDER
jgi:hypothetical protein